LVTRQEKNARGLNHCSGLLQGVGGDRQEAETLFGSPEDSLQPPDPPVQESEMPRRAEN